MPKRGLSNEHIIDTAARMVEESGYDKFSLRELAARLEVKPASLYNHIEGLDEINVSVAIRAAEQLRAVLSEAVEGKDADEAFLDGARAYRKYALENPELYKAFIHMPSLRNENASMAGIESFAPMREVIKSYGASHDEAVHFIRALRSVMHGFIELTSNGFMQKGPVSKEDTYEVIIHTYLAHLKEKTGK